MRSISEQGDRSHQPAPRLLLQHVGRAGAHVRILQRVTQHSTHALFAAYVDKGGELCRIARVNTLKPIKNIIINVYRKLYKHYLCLHAAMNVGVPVLIKL